MNSLYHRVRRKIQRTIKHLIQLRYHIRPALSTQPVFVMGCQRTGTTTLLRRGIAKSQYMTVYYESNPNAYRNNGCRLRDLKHIQSLIDKNRTPYIFFDTKCDAQHARLILKTIPSAKIIWVYRDFYDQIPYAVMKWQGHQRDIMKWIKYREWENLDWRGENLSDEVIQLATDLYHEELTAEDGAAFFWYLRNQFFFSLELDQHDHVFLLNYAHYVTNPFEALPPVCEFIGLPFEARFTRELTPQFVGKYPVPHLNAEIEELCTGLLVRFDQHYQEQKNRTQMSK